MSGAGGAPNFVTGDPCYLTDAQAGPSKRLDAARATG